MPVKDTSPLQHGESSLLEQPAAIRRPPPFVVPPFVVVTGGPGAGKSTLVAALAAAGVATQAEAGRAVIRAQSAAGGTALPWIDPAAFAARMLDHDRRSYRDAWRRGVPCVFDRGIPDSAGYLDLVGLPVPAVLARAARRLRYAAILVAPHWPGIYHNDAERRQTPEEARRTEERVCQAYRACGYEPVPLPRASVAERVGFVLDILRRLG